MPSIDTKPHIEAKRSIMWGFIVVIPANKESYIQKKNPHVSKQGFFAFQTRLYCIVKKPCLECKQDFFTNTMCPQSLSC